MGTKYEEKRAVVRVARLGKKRHLGCFWPWSARCPDKRSPGQRLPGQVPPRISALPQMTGSFTHLCTDISVINCCDMISLAKMIDDAF